MSIEEYKSQKNQFYKDGWYMRIENNGWRPVKFK